MTDAAPQSPAQAQPGDPQGHRGFRSRWHFNTSSLHQSWSTNSTPPRPTSLRRGGRGGEKADPAAGTVCSLRGREMWESIGRTGRSFKQPWRPSTGMRARSAEALSRSTASCAARMSSRSGRRARTGEPPLLTKSETVSAGSSRKVIIVPDRQVNIARNGWIT